MNKPRSVRLDQFDKARERLRELVQRFEADRTDTGIRDGLIQRFGFTFELAWKCARDWLREFETDVEAAGPTATLRASVQRNLIQDGNGWAELLAMRNQTTHVYDEQQIEVIVAYVLANALAQFDTLAERLRSFK